MFKIFINPGQFINFANLIIKPLIFLSVIIAKHFDASIFLSTLIGFFFIILVSGGGTLMRYPRVGE